MSQNLDDIEYRALFDQFVQLPKEGHGYRSPSPPSLQPFDPRSSPQRPKLLEVSMKRGEKAFAPIRSN
jgi:hypothetical protein